MRRPPGELGRLYEELIIELVFYNLSGWDIIDSCVGAPSADCVSLKQWSDSPREHEHAVNCELVRDSGDEAEIKRRGDF